jgi:hypothetical protein
MTPCPFNWSGVLLNILSPSTPRLPLRSRSGSLPQGLLAFRLASLLARSFTVGQCIVAQALKFFHFALKQLALPSKDAGEAFAMKMPQQNVARVDHERQNRQRTSQTSTDVSADYLNRLCSILAVSRVSIPFFLQHLPLPY